MFTHWLPRNRTALGLWIIVADGFSSKQTCALSMHEEGCWMGASIICEFGVNGNPTRERLKSMFLYIYLYVPSGLRVACQVLSPVTSCKANAMVMLRGLATSEMINDHQFGLFLCIASHIYDTFIVSDRC